MKDIISIFALTLLLGGCCKWFELPQEASLFLLVGMPCTLAAVLFFVQTRRKQPR